MSDYNELERQRRAAERAQAQEDRERMYHTIKRVSIFSLIGFMVAVVLVFAIGFANRSYSRYQRVQDAKNQQRVVEMQIKSTAQQVEVEKQKAAIRIEEAKGISESQRIIDESLTENYLTYLAIQAQMNLANSDNDTVIYIPVGNNGIPLIRDTATDEGQAQP